jgi:uncharacterized membrane protein YdjX (TVP38/TMEM64 family)
MGLKGEMKNSVEKFSWIRPFIKALVLFSVLLTGLLIVYLSPLKSYLGNLQEIKAELARMGMAASLLYTLGVSILVAFGFPRLFLCPVGGMAFGFFWGVVWSEIGTLMGSYTQFLFMRWGGRELTFRRKSTLKYLTQLLKRRGIPAIILIRQLPITGIFPNLFFALMRVKHLDFLVGTALGYLPETIPATLIGTGMMQNSFQKSFGYISAAIILLMLIWLLSGMYVRTARGRETVSDEHGSPDD